jgi:hypothetical protein
MTLLMFSTTLQSGSIQALPMSDSSGRRVWRSGN